MIPCARSPNPQPCGHWVSRTAQLQRLAVPGVEPQTSRVHRRRRDTVSHTVTSNSRDLSNTTVERGPSGHGHASPNQPRDPEQTSQALWAVGSPFLRLGHGRVVRGPARLWATRGQEPHRLRPAPRPQSPRGGFCLPRPPKPRRREARLTSVAQVKLCHGLSLLACPLLGLLARGLREVGGGVGCQLQGVGAALAAAAKTPRQDLTRGP